MKKITYFLVVVVLVVGLVLGCAKAPAPAPTPSPAPAPTPSPAPAPATIQPVTLKFVTFKNKGSTEWQYLQMFIDKVTEKGKGAIIINWVGSLEAIGMNEQPVAAIDGVVDLCQTVSDFYSDKVPANEFMTYTELDPMQERASGAYDFLDQQNQKAGLKYLGRTYTSPGYAWWWGGKNPQPKTPYDLAGRKWGGENNFELFQKELGLVTVDLPVNETYTALERGMIVGTQYPLLTWKRYSLHKVINWMIDQPMIQTNSVNIMNLKKWNSLPKSSQQALIDASIEVEKESGAIVQKDFDDYRKQMETEGIQFIKLSPADTQYWLKRPLELDRNAIMKRQPEIGAKLVPMLSK